MQKQEERVEEFSFKSFFTPFTTTKAIHWIIIIGFIVFANMLTNPFVWDDNTYLLNDSLINSINIPFIFGHNTFNDAGQYRPLTVMYFALFYSSFGPNQLFFHFIQLCLHILDTCLLFILFKKFFDKSLSFFLALVFLVHPMQVESVSYISSSDSPLFFLFGIVALLLGTSDKKSHRRTFIQYLLLFASILVKETGALFFPLVILYGYLFKRKRIVINTLYAVFTFIIYLIIRETIGNVSLVNRPMIPIARLSLIERLFTMPQATLYYIKTFFYPVSLAVNQQWVITSPTFSNFYLPLLLNILYFGFLIVLGAYFYKKRKKFFPIYGFFLVWYVLGLGIHSQIVALDATVADRWAYFDIAGLVGLIGVIIQNFSPLLGKFKKPIFIALGALIVSLFSLRTIVRNNEWSNPVLLWTHDSKISDNYLSEEELSLALMDENRLQEAILPAKKSIASFPNDLNYYNLGYIYETLGNLPRAQEAYLNAYHSKNYIPWQHRHYLTVYARLGKILVFRNEPTYAKKVIEDGLEDYPNTPQLWFLLALSEYELKNHAAAVEAAYNAKMTMPNNEQYNSLYEKILNNQSIVLQNG
jgi:tetratricopeptide (TPR) repeat protein